jgi:phosphonate transport system permease protein
VVRYMRPPNWPVRIARLVFSLYFAYALSHLQVTPARFIIGLERGQRFRSKLFPPGFHCWELLVKGLKESLQIAILASVLVI